MAKNRRLTLVEMGKNEKLLSEKKLITIETPIGKYDILLDKKFRKTKILALVLNCFQIISSPEYTGKKIELVELNKKDVGELINILAVKYFTDIQIPEIEEIENLIKVSKTLIDLGIIDKLFNEDGSGFDQSEFKEFSDYFNETVKRIKSRMTKENTESVLKDLNAEIVVSDEDEEI